jgi:hypothetical protein
MCGSDVEEKCLANFVGETFSKLASCKIGKETGVAHKIKMDVRKIGYGYYS